jgi:sugar (pentulose or hexulose) kinase
VFGIPTVTLTSCEGAALGAAIQAAWNAGSDRSIEALYSLCDRLVLLDESTRLAPDPRNAPTYKALLDRATRLRDALASKNLI